VIDHPSYKSQPAPHEAIILSGHSAPPAELHDALTLLDDAEDYALRTAEGRWWVVYTSPYRAPDDAVRRAALRDLNEALARVRG
jgi:hypothetical protein